MGVIPAEQTPSNIYAKKKFPASIELPDIAICNPQRNKTDIGHFFINLNLFLMNATKKQLYKAKNISNDN